jgi:hypothetical protein
MGLGKGEEEDRMLEKVTKERRKMDIEKEDTEDSLKKKAEDVAHLEKIMSDVKKMNEVFFCEGSDGRVGWLRRGFWVSECSKALSSRYCRPIEINVTARHSAMPGANSFRRDAEKRGSGGLKRRFVCSIVVP